VYEFDLIALDSGPAGAARGRAGDRAGRRAAIVEEQRTVGSVCTGTIPSRPLREAVVFFASVAGRREGGF